MAYINIPKKKKKENYKKNEKDDYNRKIRQSIYQSETWKQLRMSKLYEDPLCEVCKLRGLVQKKEILTLAVEVHHLISFTQGRTINEREALGFDYNNLISICRKCHCDIHTGELKGCESKEDIVDRLKFLQEEEKELKTYLYKGTN